MCVYMCQRAGVDGLCSAIHAHSSDPSVYTHDLNTLSPSHKQVGAMVAIVKAVLQSGHSKPYRPIDLKLLPPNLPYPRVEPGRIEVH